MFRAIRRETCYVRTYIVEAITPERAAQIANALWPYRNMEGAPFKAEDFKDVGLGVESDECLLPDH